MASDVVGGVLHWCVLYVIQLIYFCVSLLDEECGTLYLDQVSKGLYVILDYLAPWRRPMDMALFGSVALTFLPVSILPALVTVIAFHISKEFKFQSENVVTFWSVLVTLLVLESGKLVTLRLAPWLYDLSIGDLIGVLVLGIVPSTLVTFAVFRIYKARYFAEKSTVELMQQSLLVAGTVAVFIVFKICEIQSIAEIINW